MSLSKVMGLLAKLLRITSLIGSFSKVSRSLRSLSFEGSGTADEAHIRSWPSWIAWNVIGSSGWLDSLFSVVEGEFLFTELSSNLYLESSLLFRMARSAAARRQHWHHLLRGDSNVVGLLENLLDITRQLVSASSPSLNFIIIKVSYFSTIILINLAFLAIGDGKRTVLKQFNSLSGSGWPPEKKTLAEDKTLRGSQFFQFFRGFN